MQNISNVLQACAFFSSKSLHSFSLHPSFLLQLLTTLRSNCREVTTHCRLRSVCPTESDFPGSHPHINCLGVKYPFKGKYCVHQHTLDKVFYTVQESSVVVWPKYFPSRRIPFFIPSAAAGSHFLGLYSWTNPSGSLWCQSAFTQLISYVIKTECTFSKAWWENMIA